MSDYYVEQTQVDIDAMVTQSDLNNFIIGQMCIQVTQSVELQCKHVYWNTESV